MRFQLRTVLILLTLCAVGAAYLHYSLDYPAAQEITTREEWDRAIPRGECVVFVFGDWNFESEHMRRVVEPFSNWASRKGFGVLTLTIDPQLVKNDVWHISAEMIQKYGLPGSPGPKNFNGGGRVLWLKNGKLVDQTWGWMGDSRRRTFLQELQDRTERAFK